MRADDEEARPTGPPAWYEPALRRLTAAAERAGRRTATALHRVPLAIRVVVGGLLALALLLGATLVPLFYARGDITAEVTGRIPASLPSGQVASFQLAVDNTGDRAIQQLCLLAGFDRPATLLGAVFQGVDRQTASGNRVCGGLLNGGEVVGIELHIRAAAGPLHITLTPQNGSTAIGPPLTGDTTVG